MIIILFSIQNELYGKLLLLFVSWTFLGCVPLSLFFFFKDYVFIVGCARSLLLGVGFL